MPSGWFDFPVTTAIILIAVIATAAHITGVGQTILSPMLADRAAIAGGELWRLATGPFVHATWGHLVRDLVVVAGIGIGYEKPLRPVIPTLALVSLAAPTAVVLASQSGLAGYYGLSGMSHAWIAAALAYELLAATRSSAKRALFALFALGFAAKLAYEQTAGPSVIPTSLGDGASPVPLAHLAGALAAIAVVVLARSSLSRRPSQRGDRVRDTH